MHSLELFLKQLENYPSSNPNATDYYLNELDKLKDSQLIKIKLTNETWGETRQLDVTAISVPILISFLINHLNKVKSVD